MRGYRSSSEGSHHSCGALQYAPGGGVGFSTGMGRLNPDTPEPPYSPKSNVSDRSSMSDFMFDCDLDASAESLSPPGQQRSLRSLSGTGTAAMRNSPGSGGAEFKAVVLASAVSSSIGRRNKMEDVHVVVDAMSNGGSGGGSGDDVSSSLAHTLSSTSATSYYAVFDGHAGTKAAEFCRDHLQARLADDPQFWSLDPATVSRVLVEAFQSVDADFLKECDASNGRLYAGSTATVCVVRDGHVWVATLGDSAAMLGKMSGGGGGGEIGVGAGGMKGNSSALGSHVMLSDPQTPGRTDEVERIERAGGWVTQEKEMFLGRLQDMDLRDPFIRNYAETKVGMVNIYRVNGDISVSRAIGDPDYKIGHGLDKETSAIPYSWNWRNAPEDHPRTFSGDLIIAV